MEQIYEQSNLMMSEMTSRIIGCAIAVHKALGPGFDEAIYQRAMVCELTSAGLTAMREVEFPVYYRGTQLGTKRVDLVVEDCLVELKAKKGLEDIDAAQVVSYLKASGYLVALLINFGCTKVQTKRFVNTKMPQPQVSSSASHTVPCLRDSEHKEHS